jgi:hypothetical protein
MQNDPKELKIATTIKTHATNVGLKNFDPHFHQCGTDLQK